VVCGSGRIEPGSTAAVDAVGGAVLAIHLQEFILCWARGATVLISSRRTGSGGHRWAVIG